MRTISPSLVLTSVSAAGGVFSFGTAIHIALFFQALPAGKHAIPPRIESLVILLPVLFMLAVALFGVAWRTVQPTSPQWAVASRWSSGFILLWALVSGFLLLVNYPLPPQVHHVDKFLLGCVVVLTWSVGFILQPARMDGLLKSRGYYWTRVVLINALVFVVVGEATLRVADPFLARSGLFGGKQSPASLKPNVPVRGSIGVTNSQGFRDRERAFERTGNAPRVLALGDSMTWGAGVSYDETFTALLEQSLQAVASGAEVVNLGVPGWGPHEEFHLLKVYGIRFHPDVVLLNFTVSNDIHNERWDNTNLAHILVVAGQSYYVHSNGNWVHDVLGPDRWYLYHNVNYVIRVGASRLQRAAESRSGGTPAGEWAPLVSRAHYIKGIRERDDIYLRDNTPLFEDHWNRTQATLLEVRDFLQTRGLPWVLVLIPDHVQLDHDLQGEFLASIGASPELYDFEKPQKLLRAWCKKNGVPVVDLFPVFQAVDWPKKMYFQNDYHLTAAGHKVSASAIFPVLQERWARSADGTLN
jgi:hypothetical protein